MLKLVASTSLCLFLLAASNPAIATIVVQQDGSGDATTIGEALTLAADDELISVGPGTYSEGDLALTRPVEIEALEGAGTVVVDAGGSQRHFIAHSAVDVEIRKLTLINGFHTDAGGSISVRGGADVTLRDCRFERNRADFQANAVHVRETGSTLLVEDCVFADNAGPSAYAITVILDADCTIRRCEFFATDSAPTAGVAANSATVFLERSLFYDNSAPQFDGTVSFAGADGYFWRNTMVNNRTMSGMVYLTNSTSVEVTQSVFVGGRGAAGIYYFLGTPGIHSCNLYFDNSGGPVGRHPLDETELVADPRFCDLAARDFTLATDSPALASNNTCGLDFGPFGAACDEPIPEAAFLTLGGGTAGVDGLVHVPLEVEIAALTKAVLIAGLDFEITWEASVAELISVQPTALTNGWVLVPNIQTGRVQVSMARASGVSIRDGFQMLTLVFRLVGAVDTSTTLKLHDTLMFDANLTPIPHGAAGGTLTVVDCVQGDVEENGSINSADGIKTLQIAATVLDPSTRETCAADFNQDGFVNSADAVLILLAAVGLPRQTSSSTTASAWLRTEPGQIVVDLEGVAGADLELVLSDPNALFESIEVDSGFLAARQSGRTVLIALGDANTNSRRVTITLPSGLGNVTAQVTEAQAYDVAGTEVELVIHDEQAVAVGDSSQRFLQLHAHPNPFNPATRVGFVLRETGPVALTLHDSRGRRVDTLVENEVRDAGSHEFNYSPDLPSGTYFLRLLSAESVAVEKLVILK